MIERWMEVEVDLGEEAMVGRILVVRGVEVVMRSHHVHFVLEIMEFGHVESFRV